MVSVTCILRMHFLFFFFFKQKTAYEMRISDWSSDVCSSDLRDVLLENLSQAVSQRKDPAWHGCTGITGWQAIDRVLEVDQTPIGKTPRSCPATYVGFWDDVRKLFADTREAKIGRANV